MTIGGWIFMVVSMGFVLGLNVFCFVRILSAPAAPKPTPVPRELESHDRR